MGNRLKVIFAEILLAGTDATKSFQANKKTRMVNGISLLSGLLLVLCLLFLWLAGVPFYIIRYPAIPALFIPFLFLLSKYFSPAVSKFSLIILINSTILLGGFISDNYNALQEVLNIWVFSTSALLLIIFETEEKLKILAGAVIILGFHLLIRPSINTFGSGYTLAFLETEWFYSISFILSMVLIIGTIMFSQNYDSKIYNHLLQNLQENNEKLRVQEEEIRQSYEELKITKEQIYAALETVNENKGHLEVAMRIAKMGSFQYYFEDNRSIWSEELKNLIELDDEERLGENLNILKYIVPEDLEKVKSEIKKIHFTNDDYTVTFRIKTKNGKIKSVLSAGVVFDDLTGKRAGIRGVIQDISDYKQIEAELIETNQELENFVYRAYHDIKGPLATIKGVCYIASISTSDPISTSYFSLLKKHTFQLENIISKLLIINELKAMKPAFEKINIEGIIDEVLITVQNLDGYKQVIVKQELFLPNIIFGDKIFLKIILQNLIENSIGFKAEHQAWIKITVSYSDDNKYLKIAVSDNGIGVPEEYYNKIFERYFRVSEKSKGTGLGLFIVKKLAEKLDAKVTVRSMPYVDTTFTVTIPLQIA